VSSRDPDSAPQFAVLSEFASATRGFASPASPIDVLAVRLTIMTTVATCSNPAEAMLLKSLLEANDITAYVPDELTAQSAPHFSGSGIRIQVDDQRADEAKRLLADAENRASGDEDEDDDDGVEEAGAERPL
jgi:hypothetical protein